MLSKLKKYKFNSISSKDIAKLNNSNDMELLKSN